MEKNKRVCEILISLEFGDGKSLSWSCTHPSRDLEKQGGKQSKESLRV
jgi:hypothetical protein